MQLRDRLLGASVSLAEEVNENLAQTHRVIEEALDEKRRHPSTQAKIAFYVSLVNSGGLMLLGAYCLKNAVDHQTMLAAASYVGFALVLGLAGSLKRR